MIIPIYKIALTTPTTVAMATPPGHDYKKGDKGKDEAPERSRGLKTWDDVQAKHKMVKDCIPDKQPYKTWSHDGVGEDYRDTQAGTLIIIGKISPRTSQLVKNSYNIIL